VGLAVYLSKTATKGKPKSETQDGSRDSGLSSWALRTEGGPWFGTAVGLYPTKGTGLRRLSSILPSSVISLYQIGSSLY